MADAAQIKTFRRRIGDNPKKTVVDYVADGSTKRYDLEFNGIYDVIVKVDNAVVLPADYDVDSEFGIVTFDTAPANEKPINIEYKHNAFTDAEAEELIDAYEDKGAVIEAVRMLMADSARLYNYKEGATEAEISQIFKNLKDLLKSYLDEKVADEVEEAPKEFTGVKIKRRSSVLTRRRRHQPYDLSRGYTDDPHRQDY